MTVPNIRRLRKKLHLTPVQFALELGISYDRFLALEAKKKEPTKVEEVLLIVLKHDPHGTLRVIRAAREEAQRSLKREQVVSLSP